MRAKQLAVAAVLGIGVLSSSAPTAVLEMEVTYTIGGVDFGPICGVPILPTDVVFTVSFVGNRFSDTVNTLGAVRTAHIEFGDAVWTEADLEFIGVSYFNGDVNELAYQFFPIDTATRLCLIAQNFPLTITGECIADGQPFQYTYTDSSQLLFDFCPEDCSAVPDGIVNVPDLLALLGAWGGPQTPGTTCDFEGPFEHVGVTDLLALLVKWGPCP